VCSRGGDCASDAQIGICIHFRRLAELSVTKLSLGVGHVNIITSKKWLKIVGVGQSPKDALQKMRATITSQHPFNRPEKHQTRAFFLGERSSFFSSLFCSTRPRI
jgi:hypothetical protein